LLLSSSSGVKKLQNQTFTKRIFRGGPTLCLSLVGCLWRACRTPVRSYNHFLPPRRGRDEMRWDEMRLQSSSARGAHRTRLYVWCIYFIICFLVSTFQHSFIYKYNYSSIMDASVFLILFIPLQKWGAFSYIHLPIWSTYIQMESMWIMGPSFDQIIWMIFNNINLNK
jgi:hypothetical protein